jgi:hypothetical protein
MDDARRRILNGETRGIPFGRYRQDKMIGELYVPAPLLWRVLKVDEENHRALLVTEKLIDCVKYHETREDITWEYCTLRKWMNGEFIREAFTAEEASRILSVWNENEDNSRFGTRGGNATRDRVFALSIREAKECFENGMDIRAAPTTYAVKKGSYEDDEYKTTDSETTGWWWLRSSGSYSNYAELVNPDGDVSVFGRDVNLYSVSVRPALWLHL